MHGAAAWGLRGPSPDGHLRGRRRHRLRRRGHFVRQAARPSSWRRRGSWRRRSDPQQVAPCGQAFRARWGKGQLLGRFKVQIWAVIITSTTPPPCLARGQGKAAACGWLSGGQRLWPAWLGCSGARVARRPRARVLDYAASADRWLWSSAPHDGRTEGLHSAAAPLGLPFVGKLGLSTCAPGAAEVNGQAAAAAKSDGGWGQLARQAAARRCPSARARWHLATRCWLVLARCLQRHRRGDLLHGHTRARLLWRQRPGDLALRTRYGPTPDPTPPGPVGLANDRMRWLPVGV